MTKSDFVNKTPGFIIYNGYNQSGDAGDNSNDSTLPREEMGVVAYANFHKIPVVCSNASDNILNDAITNNYIPVGPTRFVENVLGYSPVPNYHPDWCKSLLNRKTWIFIGYPHGSMFENRNEIYVKPARCVKQFDARLVSRNDVDSLNKYRSFYCSESITGGFKEEYRYYVANGVVINQFCYKTNDTNVDHSDIAAPLFHEITDVIIPSDFTGTVDLAIGAKDGKIYLVETHEPYSIGWYGDIDIKSVEQYVNFLSIGWSYLTSKYGKNVKNN